MEEQARGIRFYLDLLQYYLCEIWHRKWWVAAIALVVASLFVLNAWLTPKTYSAQVTFMINDDEGNALGGVGAILGSLGFGGSKGGKYNYEKIAQLTVSRKMLSEMLFAKATYKGKTDLIGNHFLDVYHVRDEWAADTLLKDYSFVTGKKDKKAAYRDQVAVFKLSKSLRGNPQAGEKGIISVKYDDESTILTLSAETISPSLSIIMANALYDQLSEFYIEKTLERQQATYDHVKGKVDSIYAELRGAENRLAGFQDQAHGLILNTSRLPREQLGRKVEMLYLMYGEAVKNMETAEFLLKNATPYFQVIDQPVEPLQPLGKSRLKALIIGGFVGVLLGLGFVAARRYLLDEIAKEKEQKVNVSVA